MAVPVLIVLLFFGGLQAEIDALPQPAGGVVHVVGRHTLTKPLDLENRQSIKLVGDGWNSTILTFMLTEPGPGIWMKGTAACRISDMSLSAGPNVTATVLVCRNDAGHDGKLVSLDNVAIIGRPIFAGLFTAGTDLLKLSRMYISIHTDGGYGWYACGSKIPTIRHADGQRPRPLTGPGGARVVGQNYAIRVGMDDNSTVFCRPEGKDATAIYLEDQISVRLSEVYIANHDVYHADQPPAGRSCLTLAGEIDLITLQNVHTESNDSRYGLHVRGKVTRMNMTGCRFQARRAIAIGKDATFWPDPAWERTNLLRSLDDLARPVNRE